MQFLLITKIFTVSFMQTKICKNFHPKNFINIKHHIRMYIKYKSILFIR